MQRTLPPRWLLGLLGWLVLASLPGYGQNVNDATRPRTTNFFDPSGTINFNDLIRAGQELQDLENRPLPEQRQKALDEAIQQFRQSRQIQIGPNILASPTPSPSPTPSLTP
ncbi:MAG: hypothetical protein Q6J68_00500 [Thermostichales cyanobacterium SZTDM-1c_bins_54]